MDVPNTITLVIHQPDGYKFKISFTYLPWVFVEDDLK